MSLIIAIFTSDYDGYSLFDGSILTEDEIKFFEELSKDSHDWSCMKYCTNEEEKSFHKKFDVIHTKLYEAKKSLSTFGDYKCSRIISIHVNYS